MKKYLEFILEARASRASQKASQLNLKSDGHGYWVDSANRVVAKTVKGDLVFVKKKSPSAEKTQVAPPAARPSLRQDEPLQKRVAPQRQAPQPEEQPAAPEPEVLNVLTAVFGRFNPPTIGHEKLLRKAKQIAQGGDLKIYPSRMTGDLANPLDPKTKIFYMRKSYPQFDENIINNDDMKTIFDVLKRADLDGYDAVNLVTGSKRKAEFERLSKQYNGEIYDLQDIKIIPLDSEDPDLENSPNPTSSAALRKAASEDDFFSFQRGISKKLDPKQQKNLFFAVQKALSGEKEESWKISPEENYEILKEAYYQEKIYRTGDIIENFNTGLSGKIIRRGPNYVICVNENLNVMFKSWITDIREWTDVSGVPPEQREVGTDAYLNYVMKMTGTKVIQNFLEKRKKTK
jgi:hypothetical protein